jgi:hypothetical protein
VAEGDGLLNADQHFGHRVFPRKSSRFNHFLNHATWLLLALEVPFWKLAGTILGTLSLLFSSSHIASLYAIEECWTAAPKDAVSLGQDDAHLSRRSAGARLASRIGVEPIDVGVLAMAITLKPPD